MPGIVPIMFHGSTWDAVPLADAEANEQVNTMKAEIAKLKNTLALEQQSCANAVDLVHSIITDLVGIVLTDKKLDHMVEVYKILGGRVSEHGILLDMNETDLYARIAKKMLGTVQYDDKQDAASYTKPGEYGV